MKIYLLKPSERWSCCGGGAAVIAKDIESLKKIFEETILLSDDEYSEHNWETWKIVESLETKETEERLIFCDYNWG